MNVSGGVSLRQSARSSPGWAEVSRAGVGCLCQPGPLRAGLSRVEPGRAGQGCLCHSSWLCWSE